MCRFSVDLNAEVYALPNLNCTFQEVRLSSFMLPQVDVT